MTAGSPAAEDGVVSCLLVGLTGCKTGLTCCGAGFDTELTGFLFGLEGGLVVAVLSKTLGMTSLPIFLHIHFSLQIHRWRRYRCLGM